MELTIKIDDNNNYQMLVDFLKSIKINAVSEIKKSKFKSLKEFRLLSGLWKDRKITLEQIREKAWPARK